LGGLWSRVLRSRRLVICSYVLIYRLLLVVLFFELFKVFSGLVDVD
jgi:hypothetical protein